MMGDLRKTSTTQLLEYVQIILSKPDHAVSVFDQTELDQINTEMQRRFDYDWEQSRR